MNSQPICTRFASLSADCAANLLSEFSFLSTPQAQKAAQQQAAAAFNCVGGAPITQTMTGGHLKRPQQQHNMTTKRVYLKQKQKCKKREQIR